MKLECKWCYGFRRKGEPDLQALSEALREKDPMVADRCWELWALLTDEDAIPEYRIRVIYLTLKSLLEHVTTRYGEYEMPARRVQAPDE